MDTPIRDFVRTYAHSGTARFHMPGHKGQPSELAAELYDITEIKGADYLFQAQGAIAESEANCSRLFGTAATCYSTEGSSLCVKTMVALAALCRKDHSAKAKIVAARNCHSSFVSGCILADVIPVWVYPEKGDPLCSCTASVRAFEEAIDSSDPCAVYVTSPDYLGGTADISKLSQLCRKKHIPLLVDNAHGAYLRFLSRDSHPITLGADVCCDSAHKTLPVLTGGAYLHFSKNSPAAFAENAKRVMSLFGSTSPSFLTLQSLDLCNRRLAAELPQQLENAAARAKLLCSFLREKGFSSFTNEPLKLTVRVSDSGHTGDYAGDVLRKYGAEPEYSDRDHLVLMISPANSEEDFKKVELAFSSPELAPKLPLPESSPELIRLGAAMSPREAAFSPWELLPVSDAVGRVCACAAVSCQPSVPLAVSGELLSGRAAELLIAHGITELPVVKNQL